MDIIWYTLNNLKSLVGYNSRFHLLFQVAKLIFITPHSNSGIKRVYSLVNKTKRQGTDHNRLDIKLDRHESKFACYNSRPDESLLVSAKKATRLSQRSSLQQIKMALLNVVFSFLRLQNFFCWKICVKIYDLCFCLFSLMYCWACVIHMVKNKVLLIDSPPKSRNFRKLHHFFPCFVTRKFFNEMNVKNLTIPTFLTCLKLFDFWSFEVRSFLSISKWQLYFCISVVVSMDILFNFSETFGILTLLFLVATNFRKKWSFIKRSLYLNGLYFLPKIFWDCFSPVRNWVTAF